MRQKHSSLHSRPYRPGGQGVYCLTCDMMAGSAVAADALLLALAPVAARRAGRVAENAAPARPAVALPARRVTRRSVLALTLVPTARSFALLKGQSVTQCWGSGFACFGINRDTICRYATNYLFSLLMLEEPQKNNLILQYRNHINVQ